MDDSGDVPPRDVSLYFGLSYANYLVWPRLFMEDMPADWQAQFCALADEYNARFADLEGARYEVNLLARAPELIEVFDQDCPACIDGYRPPGSDDECPECDGTGRDLSSGGYRYELPEEVGRVDDWRSDYRRGQRLLAAKKGEVTDA